MKPKSIMVIDGNSLMHRAFYALPMLTNKKGVITNAVYGFANMLLKLIEDYNPQYLGVAFDKKDQHSVTRFIMSIKLQGKKLLKN